MLLVNNPQISKVYSLLAVCSHEDLARGAAHYSSSDTQKDRGCISGGPSMVIRSNKENVVN